MTKNLITIENLTKDYGGGRGVFDINLQVKQGECIGYVGTNGSGKTTTIRSIMGFIKPEKGEVLVKGCNAWKDSVEIKKYISYVPGEIAFPYFKTGMDFLKTQATYLGITNLTRMNQLIDMFRLDPSANLMRMSKGMKQKTALVAALMGDCEILILDEPTTGLDPLMREVFIDLINIEKERGKTIFISDHIFEEVEELCDRTIFIKDGRIIDQVDMDKMRSEHKSIFHVGFSDGAEEMRLTLDGREATKLFRQIKGRDIKYIREEAYTLENYFNEVYKMEGMMDE